MDLGTLLRLTAERFPDNEAIDAFCKSSPDLAPFKRPRQVVFVKDIPKTASGKILRQLLRDGQYESA